MNSEALKDLAVLALEERKGVNIKVMDVRGISDMTDYMIIASGTSDRHLKSLADFVVQKAKEAGEQPLGEEGRHGGEWALVDLGVVIVHVMNFTAREYYNLEKLWMKVEERRTGP